MNLRKVFLACFFGLLLTACSAGFAPNGAHSGVESLSARVQASASSPIPTGCYLAASGVCVPMQVTEPQSFQIYQRGASGGMVSITATGRGQGSLLRVVAKNASAVVVSSATVAIVRGQPSFSVQVNVPAGGWYSLWLQELSADSGTLYSEGTVNQFGVGEVFLTAGQSNSVATGQVNQTASPLTSAAALNSNPDGSGASLTWRSAIDNGTTGSAWPMFASLLSAQINLPVAVIELGSGGSTIAQWQAGQGQPITQQPWLCNGAQSCTINLSSRVPNTIHLLHGGAGFRAILWHQGESETWSGVANTTTYYNEFMAMKAFATPAGANWFVAQASYFPGDEVDPNTCNFTQKPIQLRAGMLQVRAAQRALAQQPGIHAGADTDPFIGAAFRYPAGSCVHMTAAGLQVHGSLWYKAVSASQIVPGTLGGNTLPFELIYRYVSSSSDHLLIPTLTNLAPYGWTLEGPAFETFTVNPPNSGGLYACVATQDHDENFISNDPGCEGSHLNGPIGYMSNFPYQIGTTTLMRFYGYSPSLLFLSTTYMDEGLQAGYILQGTQGFVPK